MFLIFYPSGNANVVFFLKGFFMKFSIVASLIAVTLAVPAFASAQESVEANAEYVTKSYGFYKCTFQKNMANSKGYAADTKLPLRPNFSDVTKDTMNAPSANVGLDSVINIGKQLWQFLKDNQPVLDFTGI